MTTDDLSVFFRPSSVAVIGASREPGKLGHDAVRNLIEHGYPGPIYPVNPRADTIMGLKVYSSIGEVPESVELVVIALPADRVAPALEACGQRGVQAAIVISGGFREVGPEGAEREERLQQIAGRHGMALLGPNCIGTIDTHTPLNTTFVTGHPPQGGIALLSQSGALAATVIDWAAKAGVGFSRIVSLGNQAGVNECQMLEIIAQDRNTRVVMAYIEGVSDGRTFLDTAARVTQNTPIIALKVGRGVGAARAVTSHTGALAGTEAAYDAAFRRAGVLRAGTLEEMLDWAQALAMQPLPGGKRVAVLTNAGGPGILAVEALETAGMILAPLTEDTKTFLRPRVPAAASVENPVDILAGSGPATYALCLDALINDETVDAVVVITAPQDWFAPSSLAEIVGDLGNSPAAQNKPVLTAIMGPGAGSETAQILRQRHIPNYAFPERLGSTLAAMWQRKQWLNSLADQSPLSPLDRGDRETAQIAIEAGLALMRSHVAEEGMTAGGEGWIPPGLVVTLMKAYGIETPRIGLAPNVRQARAMARTVGYPVALKLALPGLTHRTEVGGVMLNIDTPETLEQAFADLIDRSRDFVSDPEQVEGVYVQQMVRGVTEVIIGAVHDPQFGLLVMVGGGGTQVELLGDVTFELAPLNRKQVEAMLDRTTVGRLLAGFRGSPPGDREIVIKVILLLAQIAREWPQVAEIEINPLIVMPQGKGASAVDVRLRVESVNNGHS